MKILALEPYGGGSHAAFLKGWSDRSFHTWEILALPPYKWKWRMRHAAITFRDMIEERLAQGASWDCIFCSDMLNGAEFKGLASKPVRDVPLICYFHENQLTYPVQHEDERDYHFVMVNIVTCFAADGIWFNSEFHMESFLSALPSFLKKMPDYTDFDADAEIRTKSLICPPGIEMSEGSAGDKGGPLRILWAARWEHDKNPDDFFKALSILKSKDVEFRLNVIGEQFREYPAIFDKAREEFASQIDRWGYQESREEYLKTLQESDVIVSTAIHEFFGISVVEAASAGILPLVPKRLSYPEIFPASGTKDYDFFYDGTPEHLAARIEECACSKKDAVFWKQACECTMESVRKYRWDSLVPEYDRLIEQLTSTF